MKRTPAGFVTFAIGITSISALLVPAGSCFAEEPPVIELKNRLGDETSPYLLQHQNNPVHWYPWGEEAFEAARALDRPIFLSVGYSTCYWCHVMERESFESEDVAHVLNEHFVCIKVDREERPDVDDVYMAAVNLITQRGGWPMSVFMEPDGLQPFYGGTYFPKEQFVNLLQQVDAAWDANRDAIIRDAATLANAIREQMSTSQHRHAVGPQHVDTAVTHLMSAYDGVNAGFGHGANKFPTPVNLDFLMAAAWDREDVQSALLHTLDRMAMGGMYDQVGGGFHRYSTDRQWLVPHFEKMLYDNGQLASTYAEAYARTQDPYYAEIVRETLDYVLREMTGSDGAFYSAQDAEVNHREGQNYIWTAQEIKAAIHEPDDQAFVLDVYGFDKGTNFQDPHHPEDGRKNVVYLPERPNVAAKRLGMTIDEFNERLDRINTKLLTVRDRRDQPVTDDKILTGWNGLMIAGFADAGRALGETRYVDVAATAAERILTMMRLPDGDLARTARGGTVAAIGGFLEDYAYLVHGLLALHAATDDERWLDEAVRLADTARTKFMDADQGAFFDTIEGQSDLFVRVKSTYDGATPSGNGMMLVDLVELAHRTGRTTYLDDARRAIDVLSAEISHQPTGCITTMLALRRMNTYFPGAAAGPEFVSTDPESPVKHRVSIAKVNIAQGASEVVHVTLRMDPGYHVNAHEAGLEFLIPTEITLVDGAGLEMDVRYPPGERMDGPDGAAMFVHHGEVTIDVLLARTGPITGTPKLVLTYQTCKEHVCLAPVTETLDVEVTGK